MLHPNKGEGEHQKPNKRRKGPQLLTATLLFAYPICLAQAANAQTTSSFGESATLSEPYGLGGTKSPYQLRTGIASLDQLLQGANPNQYGQRFPYTSFLRPYNLTPEEHASQLAALNKQLSSAQSALQSAKSAQSTANAALTSAKAATQAANAKVTSAQEALQTATSAVETAKADLSTAEAALVQSTQTAATASSALQAAQASYNAAASALAQAQAALTAATSNLTNAQQGNASASSQLSTAQQNKQTTAANLATAQTTYNQAVSALAAAQQAYDSSQVPNPLYVTPTLTTQPTTYQIPDANFQTGTPWTGDGSDPGQPQIHPGHIHYSYTATEVYQDILIAPRAIANYTFTVSVYNQDTNTINYGAPTPDTYGLRIYFYDENNVLLHQSSVTSNEVHSWRDIVLQGDTNTTTPVASVRIAVYGQDNGFWQGTYGPAMNNVRLQLGWIVGSTQAATSNGTMQVDIGEGGESTFTAPSGGTFTSSNLRYESYNNPTCGAAVQPQLGSSTITLAADNGVWGDTCGGEVKHLVGTLTYSYPQPQFIKDETLLPAITTAQAALTAAYTALTSAQTADDQAAQNVADAQAGVDTSGANISSATTSVEAAQANSISAQANLTTATSNRDSLQVAYDAATAASSSASSKVEASKASLTSAEAQVTSAESDLTNAEQAVSSATSNEASAEDASNAADSNVSSAEAAVASIEAAIQALPEPTIPEPTPTPTPTPSPTPEEPTSNEEQLTPGEQKAEELKTEAAAIFETAAPGSPEYEKGLEILAEAAKADDPQLPTELAAIPGAAEVLAAFNALGNIGADMSPAVREESEKVVVSAVVATSTALSAVSISAPSAPSAPAASAPSSGGSGSGSGGSSRKESTPSSRKAK